MNKEELKSKNITELKKIISDLNIQNTSKLTKQKIIDLIDEEMCKRLVNLEINNNNFLFVFTFNFCKTNINCDYIPSSVEISNFIEENDIFMKRMNFYFSDFIASKQISNITYNSLQLSFQTNLTSEILDRLLNKQQEELNIFFTNSCPNLGLIYFSNISYKSI